MVFQFLNRPLRFVIVLLCLFQVIFRCLSGGMILVQVNVICQVFFGRLQVFFRSIQLDPGIIQRFAKRITINSIPGSFSIHESLPGLH